MGYNPNGPGDLAAMSDSAQPAPAAEKRMASMEESHEIAVKLLEHGQETYEKWYNRRRT